MIDSLQANDHKTKSWREIALMFFEKEGSINMCVDNQNGGINCWKKGYLCYYICLCNASIYVKKRIHACSAVYIWVDSFIADCSIYNRL